MELNSTEGILGLRTETSISTVGEIPLNTKNNKQIRASKNSLESFEVEVGAMKYSFKLT